MAKLRVIDIEVPDGDVRAIRGTFCPGSVAPVVTVPALPAPLPVVAEPAPAEVVDVPAVVVRQTGNGRHPLARAKGRAARVGEQLLAELGKRPGTARDLAKRLGRPEKKTSGLLSYLKRQGKACVADGVWNVVNGAPTAAVVVSATPAAKSLADLILARLATGPATEPEMVQYCTAHGRAVRDRFELTKVLDSLDERGQVIGAAGERWTLARRS